MGECRVHGRRVSFCSPTDDALAEAIVVTLGPTGGRSHLPMLWGVNLGDMMTRTIKSKTLFVELPRKLFNVA